MECHTCLNAKRSIETFCKKAGTMAALHAMAKADPERMAAKVRACRIDVDGTSGQVTTHRDRHGHCLTLFTKVEQTVGIAEQGGLIWLTQEEYAAWMNRKKGKNWDAAWQEFADLLKDPSVQKMKLPGSAVRVPVMKPPETLITRTRTFSKGLRSSSQPLETEAEATEALADMGQVGTGAQTLSPAMFGSFGRALTPGTVVGTTANIFVPNDREHEGPGPSAVSALANLEGLAPPAAEPVPPLATPAVEPKKRSGPKPKYLRDCTGPLEEGRKKGMGRLVQVLADHNQGSKNAASKMRAAHKRALVDMEDDTSRLCAEFERALLALDKKRRLCRTGVSRT